MDVGGCRLFLLLVTTLGKHSASIHLDFKEK